MFEEYSESLSDDEKTFPDGKLFKIVFDCCVRKLKILCRSLNVFEELQNAFSAPNPTQFFMKQYGYRVEAKIYAINKFGYFAPGLLFEILKWIKDSYGDLSAVIMSPRCKQYVFDYLTPLKSQILNQKIDAASFKISNVSEDLGRNNELRRAGKQPFEFRDYQEGSIRSLIFHGYGKGLIEIPTAGGKSFILANYIWNLMKNFDKNWKFLILVPNKQLVVQFYKDLLDYGYDRSKTTKFTAGLKGKDTYNPEAQIIIANRQYVFLHKNELPKIDVLICDEVHQCLSEASSEFIEMLNCKLKIGCSGTIPRDKMQRWNLIGMFSNVCYAEDITTLQKHGFISKLKITLIKIRDKYVERNKQLLFHANSIVRYHQDSNGYSDIMFNDAYNAEHEYFDKHYNELYKPVFDYLLKLNSNSLILFDRIEIGRNMLEMAKKIYAGKKNVYYIDGSISVEEREKIRDEFEKQDGNLLIAQNATFSTGINIKRLSNLIFLTSSKAFSRTIQSIGRTLRLHESKTEAHLIDVSFIPFKYSQKHLAERLHIYSEMYHKKPDEVLTFEI